MRAADVCLGDRLRVGDNWVLVENCSTGQTDDGPIVKLTLETGHIRYHFAHEELRVEREVPRLKEDAALTLVMEVALANPARSREQQEALRQIASTFDNLIVDWMAWVEESHLLDICDRCDGLVPAGLACRCVNDLCLELG